MGCTSSQPAGRQPVDSVSSTKAQRRHSSQPLTESEIQSRIEAPRETLALDIDGVKFRYAYMSQRGYYPEALDKDNQDAFIVLPDFGSGSERQAFFGIFDGHGKDGHHCARFARDNLAKNILEKFSKIPAGNCNSKVLRQALSIAHNTTNDAMHAEKRFDDSLSGTTSISVLFRGRTMYVSNVGDSRAIVVSVDSEDRLIAKPMSSDQTPYRKDERERIKKYGARILSMDQIEGLEPVHENWGDLNLGETIDEGGDPPRVWSPKGDYPGTAFTRSLGDCVAEECGVIAEPEILEREIQAQDKYIIIASDGVFEFLTNQMVADMVSRFTDPLEACKAIVNASYNMWLQYEVRTDDITVICLYLDEFGRHSTTYTNTSSFFTSEEEKASMALSPTNRRASFSTQPSSSNNVHALGEASTGAAGGSNSPRKPTSGLNTSPKPSANNLVGLNTVASATNAGAGGIGTEDVLLEARPVRRTMSREKRKHMIAMRSAADEDDLHGSNSEEMKEHDLTEEEMQALVTTKSEAEEQVIASAMRNNFLFHHLNAAQRHAVIGVIQPVIVQPGDWIIRQGDAGDKFYVVDSGRFEVRVKPTTATTTTSNNPASTSTAAGLATTKGLSDREKDELAGNVVHVYESGPDQHPGFGELSLMYGKPRAASVIALTPGKLWALDRRVFKRVVLRPKDFRRDILKILKKVELFKCLNVNQMQRLVDLMNEGTYSAGERIIRQGDVGDTFYIIEKGQCACSIDTFDPNDASKVIESKVVMELSDSSYFGERALLESKPRAANVTAKTKTSVLFIDKAAFEEVLGPLAQIIDADRLRREALAATKLATPQSLQDLSLQGVAAVDSLGPLVLAVNQRDSLRKNVTLRSLVFSEVAKNAMQSSASRYLEAAKLLQQHRLTSSTGQRFIHALVPPVLSLFRQSNALHLVFDTPIVSDLASFIRTHSEELSERRGNLSSDGNNAEGSSLHNSSGGDYIAYLFACIVQALESLHDLGIVYRAVQPEALYLDAHGRIVFLDYRFCRLGLYTGGANKAFTICGASDYLAPEQIAQTGHSYPVDLWGMGVLLYELTVGSHPFSSHTEVATYSKISSFGTKANPALKFPDHFPAETKSLINQLLVPTPEARLGSAGHAGFVALKKHAFFKGFPHWEGITLPTPAIVENTTTLVSESSGKQHGNAFSANGSSRQASIRAVSSFYTNNVFSPILDLVANEEADLVEEGMDEVWLETFAQEYAPSGSAGVDWTKLAESD